jgi:hypothetical protein
MRPMEMNARSYLSYTENSKNNVPDQLLSSAKDILL